MSYRSKSLDSFNTRQRFFIFDCVLNGKKTFTEEEFIQFNISEELVKLFTAEYYQLEGNGRLVSHDSPLAINQIYSAMNVLVEENRILLKTIEQRYFKEIFVREFPENIYKHLMAAEKCFYCGITKEDIKELANHGKLYKKNERGWSFEIDRKKANLEYTEDNCVTACYWCNNAKTDEFDDIEFKPIGILIGKTLKARLQY